VTRRGPGRRPAPFTPPVSVSSGAPAPRSTDHGAAAVELALVLPLLLVLVFGIIDFGRMLNAQITLTEAAREGARAAALGHDTAARVARTAGGTVVTTTVTACPGDDPRADATVVLTHRFEPVTPLEPLMRLVGGAADSSITVTARGVMPCVG
jgi:hypothetical protein